MIKRNFEKKEDVIRNFPRDKVRVWGWPWMELASLVESIVSHEVHPFCDVSYEPRRVWLSNSWAEVLDVQVAPWLGCTQHASQHTTAEDCIKYAGAGHS